MKKRSIEKERSCLKELFGALFCFLGNRPSVVLGQDIHVRPFHPVSRIDNGVVVMIQENGAFSSDMSFLGPPSSNESRIQFEDGGIGRLIVLQGGDSVGSVQDLVAVLNIAMHRANVVVSAVCPQ